MSDEKPTRTVLFLGKQHPVEGEPGACLECKEAGKFRWHNGIPSGYHCDACWTAGVTNLADVRSIVAA